MHRKDAQGWIWERWNHSEEQSVQQLSGAKSVLETSTTCRDFSNLSRFKRRHQVCLEPGQCAENEHWTITAASWELHSAFLLLLQTFTIVRGSWDKNKERHFCFNPQKISVKPCTRDSPIHQRWWKMCSDFSFHFSKSALSLQQGQRFLRYQQEQPLSSASLLLHSSSLSSASEVCQLFLPKRKEWQKHSKKKKNREIPTLMCDIKQTIHMIFIFVTLVLLSPSCLLLSLSMLLLLLQICF